jgi:CelD/BcsL family acetyltransferase involved in cellulose biosynthesis
MSIPTSATAPAPPDAVPAAQQDDGLTCSVVSDPAGLETLRAPWHQLLARSTANGPMLSPTWLLTWWRVFGPLDDRRLRVARFCQGGRLVGLAPLLARRHWYRPGIPFRRLEPLGAGEREADAICSDYLGVIAERGKEESVARALAAAAAGGALGRWDELVWPMMDGDGPAPGLLADAFRGVGALSRTAVTQVAPYVPLPATWEEYLRLLSPARRYYVRRTLRAFERWAGGTSAVHRATTRAELDEGRRLLIALHHRRWEGRGAGVFHSPHFVAFHEAVLPQLLDAGALELLWLTARGQPVAALYNIVWDGKVYFYQSGREPDLPANVRPGIVLLARAIEGAIRAGRREFDFLAGRSYYKTQLALAERPVVKVRVAWSSLREGARALAAWGASRLWAVRRMAQRRTGREAGGGTAAAGHAGG